MFFGDFGEKTLGNCCKNTTDNKWSFCYTMYSFN